MTNPKGPVLALAGGVGGAKLARGLAKLLPSSDLAVVVNTGDDDVFHGLHVSPDLDTVMYTLSDLADKARGWGLRNETWNAQLMLNKYGADTWFNLGDKDLAAHIRRTQLLAQGLTLSQVTAELSSSLGLNHVLAPMSDHSVRTTLSTSAGMLTFQEYFVKLQCSPAVNAITFQGAEDASPSPVLQQGLETSQCLIFCPSNPFLSVDPILSIPGVRHAIETFPGPRVAVSPIVAGVAIKGPAAKLMQELGWPVSAAGVAQKYRGLCDFFVLDNTDSALSDSIKSLGMEPQTANTIMTTDADKKNLAQFILKLCGR